MSREGFVEVNPFVVGFVNFAGWPGLLGLKFLIVAVMAYCFEYHFRDKKGGEPIAYALILAGLVWFTAGVWNYTLVL